jgi:hypothetical protein
MCLSTTMRSFGPAFAFFTSVRAACDATLWQPKSGDTVQKTADALRVDVDTFKHWNPQFENVDNIHTKQKFTVVYKSARTAPCGQLKDATAIFTRMETLHRATRPQSHRRQVSREARRPARRLLSIRTLSTLPPPGRFSLRHVNRKTRTRQAQRQLQPLQSPHIRQLPQPLRLPRRPRPPA